MNDTSKQLCTHDARAASLLVKHFKGLCERKTFLLLTILAVFVLSAAKAEAANWYVSKAAHSGGNGTSWATAWNELNQINWSSVSTADEIFIDGGPSGGNMTYQTTLTVPQSANIMASTDSGRNGQIIIDGTASTTGNGIVMQNGNLFLFGAEPNRLLIRNFKNCGISIQSSSFAYLKNLEISGNNTGLYSNCTNLVMFGSLLHDNAVSVSSITSGGISMWECWVYNSSYPQSGQRGMGVEFAGGSLYNSIFGPGLRCGAAVTPNEFVTTVIYGSLFIDASETNIRIEGNGGGAEKVAVTACTSYMTKDNASGKAHRGIAGNVTAGELSVGSSIVYDGVVAIPVSAGTTGGGVGGANFQFGITGNTTTLAPSQVDPQFVDADLYTFADNVPVNTLINANYAPSPSGPAHSAGAAGFTSVSSLIQNIISTYNY